MLLACQATAATVKGHVELIDSHDSTVTKHGNFSGVAVWLQSIESAGPPLPRARMLMLQKDKKFSPHLMVVSRGSSVDFPNLDPIFHNAFSNFEGEIFDVALYPPGSSRTVRFNRAGIVRVFCNIHPAMSAVIVVVDSNFYSVTDANGDFTMQNVPPGRYELHIFHERATPEALQQLVRTVSVSQPVTTFSAVSVSETGYLPVTHKNKYGRGYQTPSDEERPY